MRARCLWTEITGITKLRLAEASGPAKTQLRRVLGFRDLVLLMIGTVIGLGIFMVPGAVPRPVGNSVGLAVARWLTGGVLSALSSWGPQPIRPGGAVQSARYEEERDVRDRADLLLGDI
jgi:hypothetical protein